MTLTAYSELIKNFGKIRSYMREFYVYGFKSRNDFDGKKSLRSYDDERRRVESWLGDYMKFVKTPEGKTVFLSVDSRVSAHNPLYNAFKTKSFTDGDITLHFILFDILHSPEIALPISDILRIIDSEYLSFFEKPMMFDESTLRKKLKEYIDEGLIISEKRGKKLFYSRAKETDISPLCDAVSFFSEVLPCGVIGSFIGDKIKSDDVFKFKHHYITGALDSEVTVKLFCAMQNKCSVTLTNLSSKVGEEHERRVVPLRIRISAQSGRQYLLCYAPQYNSFISYRIDYLSNIRLGESVPRFDELREMLSEQESKMWGVNFRRNRFGSEKTEHVEFDIRIEKGEEYIVGRLEREKRTGKVEKLSSNEYRFSADVYDTTEMIPWIRSFICRITRLNFSNRTVENNFKNDIEEMYRLYGISGGDSDDIQ